ncbi:MAG: response regulator transcription factor [Hyphomicrobiales bacterium]|nr:response regulator transcription factor [Hyphomicrobiales bacterium]
MRIAVVEDNHALSDGIARAFRAVGHGVDQLHDGTDAKHFLLTEKVDLIVLDVNLPGQSGLEILKEIRMAGKQAPVLMLTARDGTQDKVNGLDLGADDYLTKPFELAELLARARALLRRSDKEITTRLTLADLDFNIPNQQFSIAGALVEMPRRELALVEVLMKAKGGVVSKSQILDHIYGTGADVEESAIELYVHRLRKKLAISGAEIKTVRGLGYCLRAVR